MVGTLLDLEQMLMRVLSTVLSESFAYCFFLLNAGVNATLSGSGGELEFNSYSIIPSVNSLV